MKGLAVRLKRNCKLWRTDWFKICLFTWWQWDSRHFFLEFVSHHFKSVVVHHERNSFYSFRVVYHCNESKFVLIVSGSSALQVRHVFELWKFRTDYVCHWVQRRNHITIALKVFAWSGWCNFQLWNGEWPTRTGMIFIRLKTFFIEWCISHAMKKKF